MAGGRSGGGRSSRGFSRSGGFGPRGSSRFWHSHEDDEEDYDKRIQKLPLRTRCEAFSEAYAEAAAIWGKDHRYTTPYLKHLEGCHEKYFDVDLVNSERRDAHLHVPTEDEVELLFKVFPLGLRCDALKRNIERVRCVFGEYHASQFTKNVEKRLPECYPKA